MKSNGNHKEIDIFELKIHLAPSSEGVRRSADMQTISIFVGLNDPNISTVPKYFVLLASEKKIYFSLYVKIRRYTSPNFLRALYTL